MFAAIGFEAGKLFASLNSAFVRKPFRDDMYGRVREYVKQQVFVRHPWTVSLCAVSSRLLRVLCIG